MKAMNQRDAIHYIATRQEFTASALSGVNVNEKGLSGAWGRLDSQEFAQLKADETRIDYAVYSYGTPIAWHTSDGWYTVEQKFSVTTSKHQTFTRRAIAESLEGAI
jgi:hypothetical protein